MILKILNLLCKAVCPLVFPYEGDNFLQVHGSIVGYGQVLGKGKPQWGPRFKFQLCHLLSNCAALGKSFNLQNVHFSVTEVVNVLRRVVEHLNEII